jgi:hypothetical protein
MDRETANRLLVEAAQLQIHFWDKLNELEAEIGCDVDSTQELNSVDVDTLIEIAQPDKAK